MTPEAAGRDLRQTLYWVAVSALCGMLVGAAVAGALIWLNIGAVATHIARATNPFLAVVTVAIPFTLLFGGAAAASSVALLRYRRKFTR